MSAPALFVGDRVAAVAADTRAIADEAVRLIDVDYEELPAILDMEDAITPGTPALHPDSASYRFLEGRGPRPSGPHPNHQGYVRESHGGDVDAAFAGAARGFEHEFPTPRIRLRTGVDADGRIVAHESRAIFDGGAYAAGKPTPRLMVEGGVQTLEGYRVPASRHEAAVVYTNQVPGGHMRAPGQPQNVFASESHLDLIARELGIAPLELRRRNAARTGDPITSGVPWHGPDLHALLDRAAAEIGAERKREPGRGVGFALGVRHVGTGSATITLRLERDGRIEATTGVGEQGGGQHTLIQRIVAATLGIDPSVIRVRRLSTDGPKDPGIGGSRVTPVHGGAALAAAQALQAKLGGTSVAEAARSLGPGETIEASAKFDATAADHGACAIAIEASVDAETGTVRLLAAVAVVDVGQVINPVLLRGQLEGGFVYGLGMALTEDLALEDGRVRAANLGDYKLPTIADVPPLRIVHLSDHHGVGPYGSRSPGELLNPGVPAAVANAVHDASGARVQTLPITAERVWRALRRAKPAGQPCSRLALRAHGPLPLLAGAPPIPRPFSPARSSPTSCR